MDTLTPLSIKTTQLTFRGVSATCDCKTGFHVSLHTSNQTVVVYDQLFYYSTDESIEGMHLLFLTMMCTANYMSSCPC